MILLNIFRYAKQKELRIFNFFFPVTHLLWKIGYDMQVAATNIKRVSYTMNKAGQ